MKQRKPPKDERIYWIGIKSDLSNTIERVRGIEGATKKASNFLFEGYRFDDILVSEEREFRFKIDITDSLKSGANNGRYKGKDKEKQTD